MGMYDNFMIDYPLPLEEWIPKKYHSHIHYTFSADGFQSKDLECLMNNYFISNDGRIYLDEFYFESDKQLDRKTIYYHGHIRVYTSVHLDDLFNQPTGPFSSNKLWFEYDLKFTDSLLVKATMISPAKNHFLGGYDLDDKY